MQLFIAADGTVRCLYDEDIALDALGPTTISRASNVEPDHAGKWWADLGPVHGPRLGPFDRRSAALQAEADWLIAHVLSA